MSKGAPAAFAVSDGVWRVRVGRDGHAPIVVNVFIVETADGPVLIDAGLPFDAAMNDLVAGLASLSLTVADITGILLTHTHADHVGLAADLQAASGAWVAVHQRDLQDLEEAPRGGPLVAAKARSLLEIAGAPPEALAAPEGDGASRWPSPRRPERWRTVMDGDVIDVGRRRFEVVHTPGHSPGHVCYWEPRDRVLFGGDLLLQAGPALPWRDPAQDAIHEFLLSLARVEGLPTAVVLPGHGRPFRSASAVAREVISQIEAALDGVRRALYHRHAATAWDIADDLANGKLTALGLERRAMLAGRALSLLRAIEARGLATSAQARTSSPCQTVRTPLVNTIPMPTGTSVTTPRRYRSAIRASSNRRICSNT
jgi:glyoxylase-like metal-dependent hydrolase (beta-lactamase superfamily II)